MEASSATPWPAIGLAQPADELGGDEDVYFVDLPGVQQAAQHPAAAFDQHVGHLPAAEFLQQGVEPGRAGRARADQHLAAGLAQPPAIGRRRLAADGHQQRRLAGGADQLALRRSAARVSSTMRQRGPRSRRAGRSTADRRAAAVSRPTTIASIAAAQGMDDLPRLRRRRSIGSAPVRVAILPSSVIAHLAMIQGRPRWSNFR